MVLCKVPAGLREKKRLSRPVGSFVFRKLGMKKGLFAGLGMKNQPVRPEKKLISGLGEKKSVARPGGSQNAAM